MGSVSFKGDGPTKEEAKAAIGDDLWTADAEAVFDLLLQKHNPGGDRVPASQIGIVIDGIKFEFRDQLKSKSDVPVLDRKLAILETQLKTTKSRLEKGAAQSAMFAKRLAEQKERWDKHKSLAPNVQHTKPKNEEEAIAQCLTRHNTLRARHGSPPLEWSADLAKSAKAAATACHQKGAIFSGAGGIGGSWSKDLGNHGQNPYSGTAEDCYATAIDEFYAQVDDYDFGPKEQHRGDTKLFTQMIWSETTHVGMCQVGKFIIANYFPKGSQEVKEAFDYVGAITEEGKAEALAEGVNPRHNPAEKVVKKLFNMADINKDGSLSAKELEAVMERLGMSRKDVTKLMQAADKNSDGCLQIDEFLTWIFSGSQKAGKALHRAETTMGRE
eukprot:gnl/MRDRNA2_/MRDRNA2_96101_c0_seq1.p1 gnl/MRDRNA2_/MRDRNA2_96101_c0~~gnl/MRDRNA2_/MRDRNA2_96101_c0_seq1.p1  ORF type:complete len:385 (+),score=90.59 gnl/MRDRNA2_/MRDRNA2_96101_c0_seq1:83-1237(+)